MDPRKASVLAGGMAHGGHIHCENYESIGIKVCPCPPLTAVRTSISKVMAYGRRAFGTALGGCILELIRKG